MVVRETPAAGFLLAFLAFAFALVSAKTLADSESARYVEVGVNEFSAPRHARAQAPGSIMRSHTRPVTSQWFGHAAVEPSGKHEDHRQRQIDGFDLEEERARHEPVTSHSRALEEESQRHGRHRVQGNAGIPILQAARSKPTERDSWPRDVEDPEPGDAFSPPSDVETSPGDALLQIGEVAAFPALSLAQREKRVSDCERCKDCSKAIPNEPDPANHSDGAWCMCHSWVEWQTKSKTPGIYPGPAGACTQGCETNTSITDLDCAALNCSCDLNIYWEGTSAGPSHPSAADGNDKSADDGS